ncbi:hypothetical protein SPHINGO8AM_90029 [Sphingomonas sp. 8AM]|nr:hypothetical protein SPHINGO8AM_90029 [Sphingomonas sp. 8AM]
MVAGPRRAGGRAGLPDAAAARADDRAGRGQHPAGRVYSGDGAVVGADAAGVHPRGKLSGRRRDCDHRGERPSQGCRCVCDAGVSCLVGLTRRFALTVTPAQAGIQNLWHRASVDRPARLNFRLRGTDGR